MEASGVRPKERTIVVSVDLLAALHNELNGINVSGRANLERLLACMNTLRDLVEEANNGDIHSE